MPCQFVIQDIVHVSGTLLLEVGNERVHVLSQFVLWWRPVVKVHSYSSHQFTERLDSQWGTNLCKRICLRTSGRRR